MDFQTELKNRLNKQASKKGRRKLNKQSNTIDVNQMSAFMGVPRGQERRSPPQETGQREYLERLSRLQSSLDQPSEPAPEETGGGWSRGMLATILLLTAGGAAAWGLTRGEGEEGEAELPGPPMPPEDTGGTHYV